MFKKKTETKSLKVPILLLFISKNRLNQTKNIYLSSTHPLRIKYANLVFDVLYLLSLKLSDESEKPPH